jgi:hypothetical protein
MHYLTAAKALGDIAIFTETASVVANIRAVESFVSYSLSTLATVSSYAGPAGILLNCIIAGIEAGIQIYSDQQALAALNNIKNLLAGVQAAPPDLTSFENDSVGRQKLRMRWWPKRFPINPAAPCCRRISPATELLHCAGRWRIEHEGQHAPVSRLVPKRLVGSDLRRMVRRDLRRRR